MHASFRRTVQWLLVAASLLFFWLAVSSMVGDSPTMDEQNHLARGLALLETGDPRLSLEHPPLVNSLSALPVHALLDVRLPLDDPSWQQPQGWYRFAELLLWEYNQDVTRMIFLARLPIVWLTLGLALTAFHFARTFAQTLLPGNRPHLTLTAGLLAFTLLLFDPNVLAHGRYTTTDLGGSAFLFLAAFMLWRLWRVPGWAWGRLLAAGLSLGLAFGSKLSMLVFGPIFVLLALLPLSGERLGKSFYEGDEQSGNVEGGSERFGKSFYRGAGRRLAQLLLAGGVALLVVWAIFAFQWDSFTFQYPLQSDASGPLAQLLATLNGRAGPMPTFWAGIEQILLLSGGGRPSFLLGETSTEGFLAYFPVAFLSKTPLPTLLLLATTFATYLLRAARKRQWPVASGQWPLSALRPLFLLFPPALYFLVSMSSNLNLGYRHLLPMLPFLYTFIAVEVAAFILPAVVSRWGFSETQTTGGNANAILRPHSSHLPTLILLLLLLLPALRIHPHYLSSFNLLAGGPENGYNILVDSNVDWGQDLLRLRAWMEEHEVERVKLAWFGSADPNYYGIAYDPLPGLPRHFNLWWLAPADWAGWEVPFDPASPPPGIYAISASNLWELPLQEDKHVFPWFRARRPDDRIGYSILIYEVEG